MTEGVEFPPYAKHEIDIVTLSLPMVDSHLREKEIFGDVVNRSLKYSKRGFVHGWLSGYCYALTDAIRLHGNVSYPLAGCDNWRKPLSRIP
jgi:hypothetical protein